MPLDPGGRAADRLDAPQQTGSLVQPDDSLSQILRSLRLESGLICRGNFTSPWTIQSGQSGSAIFHAVVEGRCLAGRLGDPQLVPLEEGELVLMTRGDPHVITDGMGSAARPINALPSREVGGLSMVEHGGGGEITRILCGRFSLDHSATSLGDLLPPMIVIRKRQTRMVEWLDTTLGLISHELDHRRQGSDEILTRLSDILFVQVLRAYALDRSAEEGGWLNAVHDPRIAKALALIHDTPAFPWTVDLLAARVGMSRSAFYARFTELIAESPSRYLTRWRMRVAADLMRQQALSTAELAERVGYASEDSFSRAFRRTMGQSPSAWRRTQELGH